MNESSRVRAWNGAGNPADCLEVLLQASVDKTTGRIVNEAREVVIRPRRIVIEDVVDAERDRRLIE